MGLDQELNVAPNLDSKRKETKMAYRSIDNLATQDVKRSLLNSDGTFNRAAIYAKVQIEFERGLPGWDMNRCREYAWKIARGQRERFERWEAHAVNEDF